MEIQEQDHGWLWFLVDGVVVGGVGELGVGRWTWWAGDGRSHHDGTEDEQWKAIACVVEALWPDGAE